MTLSHHFSLDGGRMSGYAQIARIVVDRAVDVGTFDGIGERRLEELENELAAELAETSEAFVDFVAKSAALGADRVREDLETFADIAAASVKHGQRRAA